MENWKTKFNNNNLINNAHDDYLNKIIKLDNQEFSTCSRDGKIKFWTNQYKEKYKIYAHSSYINSILKLKSGKLVSGSNGDKKIKFWDLNNYSKIKTFSNINSTQYNNCLIEVDNNIFVGEKNGIRILQ